ncbi:hypothetical protein B0J11DRAFT_578501 [Dendryphion nanum]|uniref:Uncharacterized protein n=1 Tax=Dendryphion nanum TaxID=256645 RepID=A0A9P9IR94_9PLEO|nr:hypothetical protein B0J11DRAFT_578501 [Dendryphion nanum]
MQTPKKPADFGKAIGINKPANVRDKIKKWQAELEGEEPSAETVVPAITGEVVNVAPSPKPQSTPKAKPIDVIASPKPTHTPNKSIENLPERPKSAKKPATHNKLDEEVLIATAPKKRVISDSHWRTNKSPPKDGASRPSPKALPNAWVRPAARKVDSSENKPESPAKPEKVQVKVTTKKRNAKQRRLSQPASSGNEERPASSGSGSANAPKFEEEDVLSPSTSPPLSAGKIESELVRIRRRRRTETSPRSSMSAEDAALARIEARRKSTGDHLANLITVEYEPSLPASTRDEEIRERRRRRPRRERIVSPEDSPRRERIVSPQDSPKEPISTGRRRSRRSSPRQSKEDVSEKVPEPEAAEAPTKVFGTRLEAWLSSTPDPFVDAESRTRQPSKESVSTLELSRKPEKSEVSASSAAKEEPVEVPQRKRSRRRRRKSPKLEVETQNLEDEPSTVVSTVISSVISTEPSEVTSVAKEDATPSPTLTLRRRGARRATNSPTKSRDVSSPQPEAESIVSIDDTVSSAPSSSVEPSTMTVEKVSQRPRPDSLAIRRMYPSTRGKRLSTIASVETFATKMLATPPSEALGSETTGTGMEPIKALSEVPESESGDQFNTETITTLSRKSTRRSRMASHADLISVLSMPRAGTRSIVSARSIRTNRSRLAVATISDIMNELASDETKYMRELRTLVDGVIPVLLSCVLSKSDSAVAAGLFSTSAKADPSTITKPIIDMGVSLERLKSLHRRVPKDSPDAFLSWSQSAQRIYNDYINVWRLGFEDVVVSLAPADEDPFTQARVVQGPEDAAPWDEGLPRNAEGYVVNGDGERVDVAYMLKRPLVRLKYLSKTLKGINHIRPSEQAESISNVFQDLVNAARKRSNDERARLEDEAAASIDPTRARDPRSLAPLAGVRIDHSRCVRARDYFDLHLLHSSGQELNCRVELLFRDDAPGTGNSGDVLFCEVDGTGRWLLLPPIQINRISSRNGDLQGEIIVMIRGHHADGSEWSELLSLRADDEQAGFDWVQMLGLQPIPPQLSELKREDSIIYKSQRPASSHASSSQVSAATASTPPQKSRTPSPHEIEIPIGEQAKPTSKKWGYETPNRLSRSTEISPITPPSAEQTSLQRARATTSVSPLSNVESSQYIEDGAQTPRPKSHRSDDESERTPRSLNEAISGTGSPLSLRRTRAKRLSKHLTLSPASSSQPSRQIVLDDPIEEEAPPRKHSRKRRSEPPPSTTGSTLSHSSKGFSVWMPGSDVDNSDESDGSDQDYEDVSTVQDREEATRPRAHRRVSSVPSLDLPSIPRLRKTSQPTTPVKQTVEEDPVKMVEPPASAPSKLERHVEELSRELVEVEDEEDKPPPVPPHRSSSPATPVTLKGSKTPVLTPGVKTKRRSSSPLKHEYEPSTCTESSSESEEEVSEDERSITSESSEDELDDDVPMPLMPIGQPRQYPKVSPPSSIYTLPNGTITPSQSASNTPYRQVPSGAGKAMKAIASIYSWSDAGRWDSLHPEECSIVVTPGKIEVFEITAVHSKPFLADGDEIFQPEGMAPLVAVELTPLVPMRKSTGLDITIRSPPTPESRIKSGNNIMLRSRNPTECSQLYSMINYSRINNPTYIALQQARGPYGQSSWAEAMDRQNAARSNAGSSGGWLSGTLGRRSSYRKTTTRAASISAATESSVGTMNTALRSALGRFRFGANGRFSIRNSTLGSRSINSADSGSMGSGSGTNTPTGDSGRAPGAPAGITNTKCRLYERDTFSSKWRDMGAARLTIMLPDPSSTSNIRQGKGSPGMRDPTQEKRIVISGKKMEEILLDVTLNESCFERIARLGIAVSVWEDIVGPNGELVAAPKTGGVGGARARVFMIQMKTERECAYSFSLLGKNRY